MPFRRGGAKKRRDAIEPSIIAALRAMGVLVWQISGYGLPDLLCYSSGRTPLWIPLEVKSGKAKLSPLQQKLQAPWQIVRSIDEAIAAVSG